MTEKRVIAISRAIGAGGEETGRIVASQLGLRYADEEIIVRAAEKAGVSPAQMADAETTPGLVGRILDALARTPPVTDTMTVPVVEDPAAAYEELIEQVIRDTAAQGNVVIVGHGASVPLAGTEGLLRVLITAPSAVRTGRLAAADSMDSEKAARAVKHSDGQRRSYLRRFYGVDEEEETHYDLVVNTENLTFEDAAKLIVTAAG
jgi:cytidylate kinase